MFYNSVRNPLEKSCSVQGRIVNLIRKTLARKGFPSRRKGKDSLVIVCRKWESGLRQKFPPGVSGNEMELIRLRTNEPMNSCVDVHVYVRDDVGVHPV